MWARSSSATSSTMRPWSIISVRLPKVRASCMLWVIIRQVMWFSATIFLVRSSTFSAVAGSKAAVCSSSSSSLGVTRVAISRVSAWRWPPESRPTGCFMRSSNPRPRAESFSAKRLRSFLEMREKDDVCPDARR